MRKVFLFQIFIFVSLFLGINVSAQEKKIETFTVADRRTYCEASVMKKCLQVKRERDADFRLFYDEIENFDFIPGYEYVLRVEVETMEFIPKDTSGFKYYLKEIVSRTKTKFDTSENIFTERWDLIRINGKAVENTRAFIRFDKKKGGFSGNTGCNSMGGESKIDGDKITLSNIFSTKRACEDSQKIEFPFTRNLTEADKFKVEVDRLYLMKGSVVILEFKPHLMQ